MANPKKGGHKDQRFFRPPPAHHAVLSRIEAYFATLLKQTGSGTTVEQFEQFIYGQGSVISFGDFVEAAFRLFPPATRVDIATRLAVMTDAWNYFPHKARCGKRPAELMAGLQNN